MVHRGKCRQWSRPPRPRYCSVVLAANVGRAVQVSVLPPTRGTTPAQTIAALRACVKKRSVTSMSGVCLRKSMFWHNANG